MVFKKILATRKHNMIAAAPTVLLKSRDLPRMENGWNLMIINISWMLNLYAINRFWNHIKASQSAV